MPTLTHPNRDRYLAGDASECRTCGAFITLAADGAWNDEAGACGCGVDEHSPGGFDQYAADQLARDTPWYDDPAERCAHGVSMLIGCDDCDYVAAHYA